MQLALRGRQARRRRAPPPFPSRERLRALKLRERGARVARRADVLGMLVRVLAARSAQRVVTRARRGPNFVGRAAAVDEQRAAQVGTAVLLGCPAVDRPRVCEDLLLDRRCFVDSAGSCGGGGVAPPRARTRRRADGSRTRSPQRTRSARRRPAVRRTPSRAPRRLAADRAGLGRVAGHGRLAASRRRSARSSNEGNVAEGCAAPFCRIERELSPARS